MPRYRREDEESKAVFPRVKWVYVLPELMSTWEQGQHMLLFGRTGKGKTTAALQILNSRCEQRGATGLVIETKARDDTLRQTGWPIITAWPPNYEQRQKQRVILWPPYNRSSNRAAEARPAIVHALDEVMLEGAWTVYLDESNYLVENLNMRAQLDEFWQGGRSSRITLMAGSQRPVWVNRGMVSQAQFAVVFFIGDREDRMRAAEILGDKRTLEPVIASLRDHECLILNTETQRGVITTVDLGDLTIPEPKREPSKLPNRLFPTRGARAR